MTNTALKATTNWLLKPFAYVLALILSGLFAVISGWTTSQALAFSIILFTFIVRLLMAPLMFNQQRSSRRMNRLQPKVQKIQDKYKDKKDPESNQRMQAEIQALYKENKANPASGCLPLLIQMPIIFALFEVLRNVPFYVNSIGELYDSLTATVQGISGYASVLETSFGTVIQGLAQKNFDINEADCVKDLLYHLSRAQWQELINTFSLSSDAGFMKAYQTVTEFNTFGAGALTYNLSENPGWTGWGILFPIVSGATTFLQSFIAQQANEKRQKMASPDGIADQTQKSMKMMTYVFPIMTAVFTARMPAGLGLYWIVSNVFAIFSQLISDAILDREEYKEALKRRDELIARRQEAMNAKSNLDKTTGGRLGAASYQQSKASLSGNKQAAKAIKEKAAQEVIEVKANDIIDIQENNVLKEAMDSKEKTDWVNEEIAAEKKNLEEDSE